MAQPPIIDRFSETSATFHSSESSSTVSTAETIDTSNSPGAAVSGRLGRVVPDGAGVRVRVGPLVAATTPAALSALGTAPGDLLHGVVDPEHVRVFPATSAAVG